MDYFLCVSVHDLGYFRPSFSNSPQYPSICETVITQPIEALDTKVSSHLMWNKELKALDYFLCDSVHDLGVFELFFPKLP